MVFLYLSKQVYEEKSQLRNFIDAERHKYRKVKRRKPCSLTPARIIILDELGLDWEPLKRKKHVANFTNLLQFK